MIDKTCAPIKPPKVPATVLATKSVIKVGAKPQQTVPTKKPIYAINNTFLRSKLSTKKAEQKPETAALMV